MTNKKLNKKKIRRCKEERLLKIIKKEIYKRNKLRSKFVEQDLFVLDLLNELNIRRDLY